MFIVDKDLRKLIDQDILQITVDDQYPPFNPLKQIGASSIDLRLDRFFRKYKLEISTIDFTQAEQTEVIEVPLDGEYLIQPGDFLLALTVEVLRLPANISGFIAVRSSIARLGLSVVEQPLIHPGYRGAVALQLRNYMGRPVKIKPLLGVCQVMFFYGTDYAEKPYGTKNTEKYFDESTVPRPSGIGMEVDENR